MGDPYKILGVTAHTTPDELRAAYRRRARETHPDHNPAEEAGEEFAKVTQAYEILKGRLPPLQPSDGAPPSVAKRQKEYTRPCLGEVLLDIKLEDLLGLKAVGFQSSYFSCHACSQSEQGAVCPECAGVGRIQQYITHIATMVRCPSCQGMGRLKYKEPGGCSLRGSGLSFRLPPGARHGDRLVVPLPEQDLGLAAMAMTRQLGVTLRVLPHHMFMARGDDLHCKISSDFTTFVLGGEIPLTDLSGKSHILMVPAGFPNNGTRTLPGAGLPKRTGTSGDLIVQLAVEIPTTLSTKQREAMQMWRAETSLKT